MDTKKQCLPYRHIAQYGAYCTSMGSGIKTVNFIERTYNGSKLCLLINFRKINREGKIIGREVEEHRMRREELEERRRNKGEEQKERREWANLSFFLPIKWSNKLENYSHKSQQR